MNKLNKLLAHASRLSISVPKLEQDYAEDVAAYLLTYHYSKLDTRAMLDIGEVAEYDLCVS